MSQLKLNPCYITTHVNFRNALTVPQHITAQAAYTSRRPISEAKYKDLSNLCKTNVIPEAYHREYLSLPHGNVRDRLAEPNFEESDDSDGQ